MSKFIEQFVSKPLPRFRFAAYLVIATLAFLLATVWLGLNQGLRNELPIFLPLAILYVGSFTSLLCRRFSDAGWPGLVFGMGSILLLALVFASGNYGIGLLMMTLLFILGSVVPSRVEGIAG